MNENNFPKEHYIKFESDPYREGRIIVTKLHDGFSVEVDVVQKESKKIWYHVGQYYKLPSENEAVEEGVQRLIEFLQKFK